MDRRDVVHGRRVHIYLRNTLSFGSLLSHLPAPSWDRARNGFGPRGNVYQHFDWAEPVPGLLAEVAAGTGTGVPAWKV